MMQLLDAEILRFSHLRDRASDMGHRKEYPYLLIFFLVLCHNDYCRCSGNASVCMFLYFRERANDLSFVVKSI